MSIYGPIREAEGIGVIVRQYRERSGMSQRQLASKINMTAGALSRIESGDRQIGFKAFARLVPHLGMSFMVAVLEREAR